MSPRPGPSPVLPESSFLVINDNQYYKRDPRRESAPPQLIMAGHKMIAANSKEPQEKTPGRATPGRAFNWKQVEE